MLSIYNGLVYASDVVPGGVGWLVVVLLVCRLLLVLVVCVQL